MPPPPPRALCSCRGGLGSGLDCTTLESTFRIAPRFFCCSGSLACGFVGDCPQAHVTLPLACYWLLLLGGALTAIGG